MDIIVFQFKFLITIYRRAAGVSGKTSARREITTVIEVQNESEGGSWSDKEN